LLSLKEELGLLDGACEKEATSSLGSDEDWEVSLNMARESIILAKNQDNILPLKTGKTYLLTGPGADSIGMQCGGWSLHWQGVRNDADFPHGITIKTALSQLADDGDTSILYHPGCQFGDYDTDSCASDALQMANQADAIIYVTGEQPYAEKPGNIDDLTLDWTQLNFGFKLSSTKTPMILVLLEGRPRVLQSLADSAQAVIAGFLPGPVGGQAIAETLFGLNNPSGKFPISYPKSVNVFPNPYWHKYSQDDSYIVQWPFGFGLSYTTFNYSNLKLSCETLAPGQSLNVHVTVTNTGSMAGKESVLCYISDLYRIITPEVKILKGFEKIELNPGESAKVSFKLSVDDFTFYGVDNERTLEDGTIEVHIGDLTASFEVVDSDKWNTI
jgi:beta-glucosidase